MRRTAALGPVSLTARVNSLERDLLLPESYAGTQSQTLLTRWPFGWNESAGLFDHNVHMGDRLVTGGGWTHMLAGRRSRP